MAVDVSVIIPAFNAEATLADALDSVLSQRGVTIEIIVIDDGSTDQTREIAKGFGERVTVLSGPNQGVSAARNKGIAASQGQWLKFLDADDMLMPGTLALQVSDLQRTSADVSICDWKTSSADSDTAQHCDRVSLDWGMVKNDAQAAFASTAWGPPAAILYNRSIVEQIGGFRTDLTVAEDARFLFDAAFNGATFIYTEVVGALYRVSPDSLSRRSDLLFAECCFENAKQIEALWRCDGQMPNVRRDALLHTYNFVARVFFRLGDKRYFDAVEAEKALGVPLPLHARLATPLARLFGLSFARALTGLAVR